MAKPMPIPLTHPADRDAVAVKTDSCWYPGRLYADR
jgi:hypothetical protein